MRGLSIVTTALFGAALSTIADIAPPVGNQRALAVGAIGSIDLVGPPGSGTFGERVVVLDNGNLVVLDPHFDAPDAVDVGAVSLYDGHTNQLISTLRGSTANDRVGDNSVQQVGASNFVVRSAAWDNGAATDAGAVTWVNGTTGLNGTVSPSNSLVGTTIDDHVGLVPLAILDNHNYVVPSPAWDKGAVVDAGAATWANGDAGVTGPVSAANSLVGGTTGDQLGLAVTSLRNGNYVVQAPMWDNVFAPDAGLAAWADGATGRTGSVSAVNSLAGSKPNDHVGEGVQALANGGYAVRSPNWGNGGLSGVGALTLATAAGITGLVSTSNSLYGTHQDDHVSSRGVQQQRGGSNFVVLSPSWDNNAVPDAGAATWANAAAPLIGAVAASNSLVGTTAQDSVSSGGATALMNGNFVVVSPDWGNAGQASVGAATWMSGSAGLVGAVSTANSLYGVATADHVSSNGVTALANGNYVAISSSWSNAGAATAGAVTWGNGATGTVGAVGASNSFVGVTAADVIGSGSARALPNGNFFFASPGWDNGPVIDAGAVTFVDGTVGGAGSLSAANSLIGTTAGDAVGGASITTLANGNYVVQSPHWHLAAGVDAGALTWASGVTPTTGAVGPSNSLVGSRIGDQVGSGVTVGLKDGNYLAMSPQWDNAIVDAGAVTWATGSGPTSGVVGDSNSLVGSANGDAVGSGGALALDGGAYVILSRSRDNGPAADAGAATYGGPGALIGQISSSNSVLGIAAMGGTQLTAASKPTAAGAIVILRPGDNTVTLMFSPLPTDFVPLTPARLAESRAGLSTVDGAQAGVGRLAGSSTFEVAVAGRGGVAADARAAALNVTAVDSEADGFVTVYPCGEAQPIASNLNVTPGATVPNAVLAKIGAGGKVCVYVSQAMDLVVDVNGYFPATSSYQSANPARLLETRPDHATVDGLQQGEGTRPADSVTEVQVTGRAGVPAGATTVVLDVTITEPAAAGFLTVFPCGAAQPTASTLNYVPGATVANLAVSKIGAGGKVCIYTQGAAQLIADLNGYFPAATTYHALVPARLLETRQAQATIDGLFNGSGLVATGTVTEVQVTGRGGVPGDAAAVVLNATITEAGGAGYVTVFPCGIDPPLASNLNFTADQTVANATAVKIGAGGKVCLFNSQPGHLIVDVAGYFPPS